MGTLYPVGDAQVAVSRELLAATITALRLGAEAVLDRDWDCYSASERLDAERYADETFSKVADTLTRLLDG